MTLFESLTTRLQSDQSGRLSVQELQDYRTHTGDFRECLINELESIATKRHNGYIEMTDVESLKELFV